MTDMTDTRLTRLNVTHKATQRWVTDTDTPLRVSGCQSVKPGCWDTSQFHIPVGTVPSLTKPYHPDAIGARIPSSPKQPKEGK